MNLYISQLFATELKELRLLLKKTKLEPFNYFQSFFRGNNKLLRNIIEIKKSQF